MGAFAPQAPEKVADVKEVPVDVVVQRLHLQVHFEAPAGQDDGRVVVEGLQHVI